MYEFGQTNGKKEILLFIRVCVCKFLFVLKEKCLDNKISKKF